MHKGICLDTELVGREELCLQHQSGGQTVMQNKRNSAEVQIFTSESLWSAQHGQTFANGNNESCFWKHCGYLST